MFVLARQIYDVMSVSINKHDVRSPTYFCPTCLLQVLSARSAAPLCPGNRKKYPMLGSQAYEIVDALFEIDTWPFDKKRTTAQLRLSSIQCEVVRFEERERKWEQGEETRREEWEKNRKKERKRKKTEKKAKTKSKTQ